MGFKPYYNYMNVISVAGSTGVVHFNLLHQLWGNIINTTNPDDYPLNISR
jgi:hypothetical protein